MPKTNLLVKQLAEAFPDFTFIASDDFRWSPEERAVYYRKESGEHLLHETAHGLLDHAEYDRDIDLLKLERDAWTYASEKLAPRFSMQIEDSLIEDALDSYRDWLHARSKCPDCQQTGIQNSIDSYLCLGCDKSWRANEARRCGLRRYRIEPTKIPAL